MSVRLVGYYSVVSVRAGQHNGYMYHITEMVPSTAAKLPVQGQGHGKSGPLNDGSTESHPGGSVTLPLSTYIFLRISIARSCIPVKTT